MANQAPDRRHFLEMLAKAAAASQFPGFSRWVFAYDHQHAGDRPTTPRPAHYDPQFYNATEYQTIAAVTEIIIPHDESPGAQDAGVSEFIDFMAAHGEEELQGPMRQGLQWLDDQARKTHGAPFVKLPVEAQTAVLKTVAYRDAGAKADLQGTAFFKLIRRYTVMGYYTSRVGLEELDFPGLKLYSHSPECSHKDDPEHRHLPAARA